MAAINITTNLSQVVGQIEDKLKQITNVDFLLKPASEKAIALIHPRIHVQGQASDGNQIGTYSKGYLAIRSGVFENSPKFVKGANKGKTKNSGVFTESTIRLNKQTGVFSGEDKVGKPRPNFHRGSDPKVIISLTRQLESDYITVPIDDKTYGVGFSNQFNFDKSQFVEKTYNKPIFALTSSEEKIISDFIQDLVNSALQA